MTQTPDARYRLLSIETNRQYAYAVVFGEMSRDEARAFSLWVLLSGNHHNEPADNLDLYIGVPAETIEREKNARAAG